jgi:serine/threonine-protein kinase
VLVGKALGPFLIESELGTGAMGTVYRAVRQDTGKVVAIKVIALGLLGNEKAVERFEREGEILKSLKHPNIVRFVGTGSVRKTPFFIMEFVEGESLDKLLVRRGAFPWEDVVDLGGQLCDALQHAHQKGIIHRDLKPSNLMILTDGMLKLTDFGIAKGAELAALTATDCTVGTAAYMSPEQCRGAKTLTAKSDLYSMGVVFYELLTGRKPFEKDSPIEMFRAHCEETFERPSRFVMDIPVWLDNLVSHLLEKKPENRPFDAAMVAKALDEVEQKVAELRSAGVDAATARSTDRGSKRPADETDRKAARTLRAAAARRRLRRRTVPFAERKWVQAVMLSTALVGLAALVFWLTRPPSADKLFHQVQAAAERRDVDTVKDKAATYLRIYGDRDEDRTRQVRAWVRELRTERLESQLINRIHGKLKRKPTGEVETLAFAAIESEDEGDTVTAAENWQKLKAKVEEDGGQDATVYGWLAQKKLDDLVGLQKRDARLADDLDRERMPETNAAKPDVGAAEQACADALRFEQFGDLSRARDRWNDIREKYVKTPEDRGWAVLAAVHDRKLKSEAVSGAEKERDFRRTLVAGRFAEAEAVPANADRSDRWRAVSICREIIALYAKDADTELGAFAGKARELVKKRGW